MCVSYKELELVQNAFYPEPTDSSAWFYHRWLVSQHPDPAVIERELGRCRELLEIAEKPAERKCTYDLADPLVESLPRC